MKKVILLIISILFLCSFSNNKKVIVIDPGHGGKDPGTIYNNIYEKDIVMNISNAIYNELSKKYIVYMTRYADYDLSSPGVNLRKKSDFDNRIKLINAVNADLYISIHLNYYKNEIYYGPQVFYDNVNIKNKMLASILQDNLNKDRQIKEIKNLYLFKNVKTPGSLIECGFLSNSNDRYLLQNKEYQIKFAKKVRKSIDNFFNMY